MFHLKKRNSELLIPKNFIPPIKLLSKWIYSKCQNVKIAWLWHVASHLTQRLTSDNNSVFSILCPISQSCTTTSVFSPSILKHPPVGIVMSLVSCVIFSNTATESPIFSCAYIKNCKKQVILAKRLIKLFFAVKILTACYKLKITWKFHANCNFGYQLFPWMLILEQKYI